MLKPGRRLKFIVPALALVAGVLVVLGLALGSASSRIPPDPAAGGHPWSCAAGCEPTAVRPVGPLPPYPVAAARAAAELGGLSGDGSPVAWDPKRGLWWSRNMPAHWWQSALALQSMVRYLERTGNADPRYQHVILQTYLRNILTPHAAATTNFVNKFLDDTAWWGLAWLEAARYELQWQHDVTDAGTFLRLAEWDANDIAAAPKSCGGLEWERGSPPDTVVSAQYAALAIGLYQLRKPGAAFENSALADQWLSAARASLGWLLGSRLVDVRRGIVADRLDKTCRHVVGGPMTYTEGEVAEALTQVGTALHNPTYLTEAGRFLAFATRHWALRQTGGILAEACVFRRRKCGHTPYNLPVYKGVLVQAIDDWSIATGSGAYRAFLRRQVAAILGTDATDGNGHLTACDSPHTCQFPLPWTPRAADSGLRIGVTVGTQTSALDALMAVLPNPGADPAHTRRAARSVSRRHAA